MPDIYEAFTQKINSRTAIVGIIGLGYVGLPLMHSMCKSGINVIGFDTDISKVEKLNKGLSYLDTVKDAIIANHVNAQKFRATNDMSELSKVDAVIMCVPTPLGLHQEPDLSYIIASTQTIKDNLKAGQLVVLESTTYPGTTNDVIKPILEETGLKSAQDFFLAYSPEREDPGNPDFETSTIPKVVGADGEEALNIACNFYSSFLENKVIKTSSAETAEAVKITENIFRAVNIALVNELKVIYDKMGIDVWEVIDAAKTKPFGYMPFYPGPGLGGHCIPIDPFYLTWKAKEHNINTRFVELAGEINTNMPEYVYKKTVKALSDKRNKSIKDSKILIIGVAYKKNVNDQRESPAFPLMRMLKENGAIVDYFDPLIPSLGKIRMFPELNGSKSIEWIKETLSNIDAAIIITDHDVINYDELGAWAPLIIDSRNALKDKPEYQLKTIKA